MCGILGVYGRYDYDDRRFLDALKLQSNRGPDNMEVARSEASITGHARLSIQDLSPSANQPMKRKQYTLIFNGEIYNFRKLKEELIDKYDFESNSDTEVLFYLLIEYGLEVTLSKIKGMYAFSFYNNVTGDVYIARDPYGEKPLYYKKGLKRITVSSSLYSIVSLEGFTGLNQQSLSNYLHYGYCKGQDTIANGIYKLAPSSYIKYNTTNDTVSFGNYLPTKDSSTLNLDAQINKSVEACLDADVPVGCFLSGGIDSSLIASYVAKHGSAFTAYSIGFENKDYDESNVAQSVADHLGITLKVKKLNESDFIQLIDDTEWIFDEPFADASYLATFALCQFARKDVTVCLSGDGGDELFSGYNRHIFAGKVYKMTNKIPQFMRWAIAKLLTEGTVSRKLFKFIFQKIVLKGNQVTALDEKIDKLSTILPYKDKSDLLFKVLAGKDYSTLINLPKPFKHVVNSLDMRTLSELDLSTYLHEDVLTKVDRCSMAASLEARVPFLDVDIVTHALSSSDDMHVNNGVQKFAFKQLLSQVIPDEIINRPKSGFSVPYKEIVDNHLKDKFSRFKLKFTEDSPLEYEQFKEVFDLIDLYYRNEFNDYKFIWNAFFFFRWMNNINQLRC